jgi:hypothetical protein
MKLFYRQSGEGRPLIILHGLFGSSDNWYSLSKVFAARFSVFAIDQRNHGQSPQSNDFNYGLLTEDLHDFILEHQIKDLFLRRMRVRIGNKTTDERATKEWIETLFGVFSNLETTDQHDLKPRRSLVIGDSHTISVWRPGSYIKRMDGKTLRGLSKTLLESKSYITHTG